MRVTEICPTLQGEGARAGEASVFVRFSGCSAKHACAEGGIVCDTEFESGREYDATDLVATIKLVAQGIRWIVWTGGEPADQLTADLVARIKADGFSQQIETSGVRPVPDGLDWVTVEPEGGRMTSWCATFRCARTGSVADELKHVRHVGQSILVPQLKAHVNCLSPHADGETIPTADLRHCIDLCLKRSWRWRLSGGSE